LQKLKQSFLRILKRLLEGEPFETTLMVNVRVFSDFSLVSFNITSLYRPSCLILEDNLIKPRGLLFNLLSLVLIHCGSDWCFNVTKVGIDISESAINLLSVLLLVVDSKPSLNCCNHRRLQSLCNTY